MARLPPVVWMFPAVLPPEGGIVRGRALRRDPDRGGVLVRNTRSIVFTHEMPNAEVRVAAFGKVIPAKADGEGFFIIELPGPLPLGEVRLQAFLGAGAEPAGEGTVKVVPAHGLSVVSDFDDTIAQSNVWRRWKLLRTALFRNENQHPPVPGMADLYQRLAAGPVHAFHYLSASPVGLLRRTERFLRMHGFPAGAVLLRHLESDPLDTLAFKPKRIEDIARALPGHRLVLFGDSGEKDPEVFAAMRARLGDRVLAALVRRVASGRSQAADAPRFAGQHLFDEPAAAAELARLGVLT